jgi:hypothetical protein
MVRRSVSVVVGAARKLRLPQVIAAHLRPAAQPEQELVQVGAKRLLRQAERRHRLFLASSAVSGVSLTNCAKPLRPAISGVRSWVAYCRHAS